jgi:integrase
MAVFMAWLREHQAERVGPALIRAWKADLLGAGRKPQGVNVLYAGVRCFFRWAVSDAGLAYDPTAGVKGANRRGNAHMHKRDPLSDGEVLRVLAQPDTTTAEGKRDLAMLALLAYTGLRSVEVQRAKIGDLHTNGMVKLAVTGKGYADTSRDVMLVNTGLLDAMYSWLAVHPRGSDLGAALFCGLGNRNRGGVLTMATIRKLVKGHYRAAGVVDPRKTTHSLRHGFVTNAQRHKVSNTKIMAATGHTSEATMGVYSHELDREEDPAEGHIDYSNGK